jgi:hypothetical protein
MTRLRIAFVGALWMACVPATARVDYGKLVAADPKSILVVPPVNKSVDVTAPDSFLSTLPVPLAERGYYVFPVNVVKRLLEDEGLSDAETVHAADPVRLCQMFGADAVLYPTIETWTTKHMVITKVVQVAFTYVLKDCRLGEEIWRGANDQDYQPGVGEGFSRALMEALVKGQPAEQRREAVGFYVLLAQRANASAFAYPGPGLPAGPYRPEYRRDLVARPTSDTPPEQAAPPAAAPDPAIAVPGVPRS